MIDPDGVLVRTIPAGTEPLPLLLGYLDVLPHADTPDAPETRHLVVEHVHDLVMLMLGATSTAKGSGVRAARLQAIKDDIAANVGRRDLALGGIAARLGVSTRYVSMLFKDEGTTFTEFVLEARLRRAHRLLNNPRKINQPIKCHRARVRIRGFVVFQPVLSPALWHHADRSAQGRTMAR
jgi:AraC-like DNA-binding protein